MNITRVTFSHGGTINTGNFNNFRFDISAEIQVQEGEHEDDAYVRVRQWALARAVAEANQK